METIAEPEIIPFAFLLASGDLAAKVSAETRLQWNIAMLRIFRGDAALRCLHHGRWPDRLSDITEVPIPVNPCDGKPFVYKRQGNKAVLTSERGPKGCTWHYEITLMPKAK